MVYQFLIIAFLAPDILLQVLAATTERPTTAAPEAATNSTSSPPKETSYFYRDPQGPGTYEFGYRIEDDATGNIQFREERRHPNGTITGKYGYLRPDGKMTVTEYVADENGYRAKTKVTKHPSSSGVATTTASPPPSTSAGTSTEIPGLNLTAGTLPPQLVEQVMKEHQIDLNPNASPSDILHPNISAIINGKVPLTQDKQSGELGFQVVHNFIPSDFPIVPFQVPTQAPSDDD